VVSIRRHRTTLLFLADLHLGLPRDPRGFYALQPAVLSSFLTSQVPISIFGEGKKGAMLAQKAIDRKIAEKGPTSVLKAPAFCSRPSVLALIKSGTEQEDRFLAPFSPRCRVQTADHPNIFSPWGTASFCFLRFFLIDFMASSSEPDGRMSL
jgi:hypothetical protein